MAKPRRPGKRPPKSETSAGEEYPIGYGKPPVATRFKKGVSGNPRGRPTPKPDIYEMLTDRLFMPVVVKEQGRIRKTPYLKAFLAKAQADALRGHPKPFIDLLKFLDASGLVSFDRLTAPQRTVVEWEFVSPDSQNKSPGDKGEGENR